MWNPFRAPLTDNLRTGSFNPTPVTIPASTQQTVHSNAVYLDDALYPDDLKYAEWDAAANLGDLNAGRPSYDGPHIGSVPSRVLQVASSPAPDPQAFTNPAPGSVDLIEPRDTGGIPGSQPLNYVDGPVSGNAMDTWTYESATNNLTTIPAGNYGPVSGGQDYGQGVANAYYQQVIADYSTEASNVALIAVV